MREMVIFPADWSNLTGFSTEIWEMVIFPADCSNLTGISNMGNSDNPRRL